MHRARVLGAIQALERAAAGRRFVGTGIGLRFEDIGEPAQDGFVGAPCPCGRTLVRIGRITGRTDDMLIVRGVNVYPSQIEHALMQVPAVAPHYLLVLRRESALDTLEVQVESRPDAAPGGAEAASALAARVRRRLHEVIGLTADVSVVPPRTIERSTGKARRVLDLRQGEGARS